MAKRPCEVCGQPVKKRGTRVRFCSKVCMGEAQRCSPADFWKRVDKTTDCWIWTGSVDKKGYGQVGRDGKRWAAHRYVWLLTYGETPTLCVLHRCDRPPCVNPAHLFLGTNKDNTLDMLTKGRGMAKLTPDQVLEVVRLYESGWRGPRIAEHLAIQQTSVYYVLRNRTYPHVERAPVTIRPPRAKLLPNHIHEIRKRYANGESQRTLAEQYHVSDTAIYRVVNRLAYTTGVYSGA
jgi:hypothetical protein